MDWKDHIVANPAILVGKPVIKGTRLSVDFILELLAAGWGEQKIFASYPQLKPEDLQAVFAFAAACLKDEEYIALERIA